MWIQVVFDLLTKFKIKFKKKMIKKCISLNTLCSVNSEYSR